jgi:hypothetical protein
MGIWAPMKTTLEIPDDLFRKAKATAALRGVSLKDLVTRALVEALELRPPEVNWQRGWRSVFGKARRKSVEQVDAVVAAELERIEPEDWR